jgi:hypothetical protein
MRKLIDYFWSYVRRGELKPYEHGPAVKFYKYVPIEERERDEYGRWITPVENTTGCGDNCKCKDK